MGRKKSKSNKRPRKPGYKQRIKGGEKSSGPVASQYESEILLPERDIFDEPQYDTIGLPQGNPSKGAMAILREASRLASEVEDADNEQAQEILAKVEYLKKLSKKTGADQEAINRQIDEAIAPVEKELKRKASFREFLKDRVQQFKKTLPEKLAGKIPLIGGILGGYLRQRREASENLKKYGKGILGSKQTSRTGTIAESLGATPAAEIPGMGKSPYTEKTLGSIYDEVKKIRTLLENKFAPESDTSELSKREAELEASRRGGAGIEGVSSAAGKKPRGKGMFRGLMDMASDTMDLFKRRGKIGRGFRVAKVMGKKLLRRFKGTRMGKWAGRAWNAVKGSRLGKGTARLAGRAWGATKGLVGRVASAATSTGGGWLSSAWNATKGVAGKAVGAAKNLGGKALGTLAELNPLKALSSAVKSSAPKLGKALMSAPGVAALMETAIRGINIAGIKNDPSLTADQKKEEIGKQITGLLGGILGSVGGGVLAGTVASVIPVAGTSVGAFLGSAAGGWLGGWLGEQLGDVLGGKNIYDLASSIPVIKSLISVGEEPKPPETVGAEGSLDQSTTSTASGQNGTTSVAGTVTAPTGANTTVGKMMNEYTAQKEALADAEMATAGGGAKVVNNAKVETRVNNTTNNFNDDLRIRNNEPTYKTMQMASHTW